MYGLSAAKASSFIPVKRTATPGNFVVKLEVMAPRMARMSKSWCGTFVSTTMTLLTVVMCLLPLSHRLHGRHALRPIHPSALLPLPARICKPKRPAVQIFECQKLRKGKHAAAAALHALGHSPGAPAARCFQTS